MLIAVGIGTPNGFFYTFSYNAYLYIMKDKIKEILNHYLHTALWTENLDSEFGTENFDSKSRESAEKDIALFIEKAGSLLDSLDLSLVGHDFWLTRNRHGAGFWDGDYEKEVGNKLTEISHTFKEINVETENGKVYFF